MRVAWAVLSHPGLRRTTNEDSSCARPDIGLFLVADGMGGHAAGEVASRVAVSAIEAFAVETTGPDRSRTWPVPYDPQLSVEANRLKAGFRLANRRLADAIAGAERLRGMATTASALLIGPHGASVAHVGDSRVYRMRAGTLDQLTRDHSWVEEQVRSGAMTASAARQHPWRNIVTRALAGADDVDVDVLEVALEPGDRLLLCSDGLYSVVPDARIADVLGGSESLDAMCQTLVAEANAAGGPDNITAMVLQVDAE